jgi:hypothetical protein
MSAQETMPGHASSSAALTASTTGYPRAELLLGVANFSDTMLELLSSRIEPSQPWEKTQHVRTRRST